jgi:alpha-mannosidase
MNRREWIKSGAMASGSFYLSALPIGKLFAAGNYKINAERTVKEIHIINLSHHDYGYTDLPSSVWDYQVNNIRLAMQFIQETKNYPAEATFKWTIEGLWGLERFWQEADASEKKQFAQYVKDGRIEVTAMPGNTTCLMGRFEWENELDRLAPFYKMFTPKVALQDDVNGLPWGLVDSLLKRNVKYVTMAANDYMGGPPLPTPSFFWWMGAEGKKILMFNGEGYANGYNYFHKTEWRKGPVPHRYDVWFNGPAGNEIFSTADDNLLAAQKIVNDRLSQLAKQGYNYSILPLSLTNMWTIDNDRPCRQLSEFIKAWNQKGLQPKLVFSTPSVYLEKIVTQLPANLPVLKGEWCDWWADGIAASPYEVAILQAARRRNMDIHNAIGYFAVPAAPLKKMIEKLNHDLVFAGEHTWGAYDSVAHPYSERTVGNHGQKFDYFFRADEDSKKIKAAIIRSSKWYKPLSQSKFIEVINPGKFVRSGWVDISAIALRTPANAVKETNTQMLFPFEDSFTAEWAYAENDRPLKNPAEIPNDVWPFFTGTHKFYLQNLQPGERRKFQLVNQTLPNNNFKKSSRFYQPVINEKTGQIKNIIYTPLNKPLFDEQSKWLPGQIVVERPQGKYIRSTINDRNAQERDFFYTVPQPVESASPQSEYAMRYTSVLEESFAKRIEQQWDIFDDIPRIEIITTIWMKENLDPLAVYAAFPFLIENPKVYYDSLGNTVEAGANQLPNTCGLFNTIQHGISYKGEAINVAFTTFDAPIGIFDSIERTKKRTTFTPKTGHFYSILCENYWVTNFAVLQPAKLVFRHIIECSKPGVDIMPLENTELWGYPSV